jgi:histidine kinase
MLGFLLAGILVWIAVEQVYLSTQQENLLAQARLTAAAIDGTPVNLDFSEPYSQTTNISPGIHARMLDESGAVLIGVPFPEGEDPVQVPYWEDPGYISADELIQRPEIISALNGQADTAVRKITNLGGQRVLYAAAPVLNGSGQVINLVYLATPLPQNRLPANLILQLLGAVLGAAVVAGIVSMVLARRIARPLEALDLAATSIANGDLTQQVILPGGIQEVDNLSKSFNEMSSSLNFSHQAKNAFIADVTHELRTPLTVIKGTVETLEDGALDDLEGRRGLLSSLGKETNRLIRLVNNLLTLTRADSDALKLNLQLLDLRDLVNERCQTFHTLISQKNLNISLNDPENGGNTQPLVHADKDRLSQVIDNILDNAIRYAPANSELTISITLTGPRVELSISDLGEGISPEHLPFIFERFYRADPARDRGSGGSGLGLAIARSLVEAQGGEIWAESQAGKGTMIAFHLPAGKLPIN